MGIQGPLTAQALGRSPYDEVVEGEGDDDGHEPAQQYDSRGRPINPETKRINREIVRAHNEVMLVIGVAEPENLNAGPEAESQRRHESYEEAIGLALGSVSKRCVEAVGIFGVHGFRQRILIYKRYSEIPFSGLYQQARRNFSFSRDILAGAPVSLLTNYVERYVSRLWHGRPDKMIARQFVHELWSYARVHLELYVAMQRLGLIPGGQWLPSPSYFIPFTSESPIPAPPPLNGFSPQAILSWAGGVFISAAPFLVWVMTQRMVRDCKPQIWGEIFKRLPSTVFRGKRIPPPPPPPPMVRHESEGREVLSRPSSRERASEDEPNLATTPDASTPEEGGPMEGQSQAHTTSGDDFVSDEEDNEGVSATLISFDVEATESTDAPAGLWSAELRPSQASLPAGGEQTLYLDTLLTQLPSLMASHILTDAVARIALAPYEAIALRLAARAFCLRRGLPCTGLLGVNLLSGLNWISAANFFGVELLHLTLLGEVWAVFTGLSQWFHLSEEEWKDVDGTERNWYDSLW